MSVAASALHTAVEAMADGAIVADTRSGEVLVNSAARAMLGIPAERSVDTTYLKDVVGFYPFDLAAGGDGQPIREEVRIGERVLHSVVTPLREGDRVDRRDRRSSATSATPRTSPAGARSSRR